MKDRECLWFEAGYPKPLKPILEWNWAYIADHWVRVVAMFVLIITGIFIHTPFISGGPDSSIMANMRFFHFVAAYTFIIGLVILSLIHI